MFPGLTLTARPSALCRPFSRCSPPRTSPAAPVRPTATLDMCPPRPYLTADLSNLGLALTEPRALRPVARSLSTHATPLPASRSPSLPPLSCRPPHATGRPPLPTAAPAPTRAALLRLNPAPAGRPRAVRYAPPGHAALPGGCPPAPAQQPGASATSRQPHRTPPAPPSPH